MPVDGSSAAVLPPAPQTDELDKDNPFEKDTDNDLTRKIREYSRTEPELEEYFELLKSGAQLAKDGRKTLASKAFVSGLSAEQKAYLKDDGDDEKDGKDKMKKEKKKQAKTIENGRFWGQSKYLKGSLLSACLAGIIQYVHHIHCLLLSANMAIEDGPNQVRGWFYARCITVFAKPFCQL